MVNAEASERAKGVGDRARGLSPHSLLVPSRQPSRETKERIFQPGDSHEERRSTR